MKLRWDYISRAVWLCLALMASTSVAGCAKTLPSDAVVRRVIDGDTIEIDGGQLVRYIGIDTPEMRRKVDGRWVSAPEPWGKAAHARNTELVEKRRVRLTYDVQTHDKYGRVLAYVWIGDVMVNKQLLADGMGRLLTIPPNVRYVATLQHAQTDARLAQRGIWSEQVP